MVPDKLKYVSSVIFKKIDEKVVQSGLNSSTSMVEALHQLDRLGFWLLVVDGLSEIADLGGESQTNLTAFHRDVPVQMCSSLQSGPKEHKH